MTTLRKMKIKSQFFKLLALAMLTPLVACWDYDKPIINNYIYSDFGGSFISRYIGKNTYEMIVETNVDKYIIFNEIIFATRHDLSDDSKREYWIIDTKTHRTERFNQLNTFQLRMKELDVNKKMQSAFNE